MSTTLKPALTACSSTVGWTVGSQPAGKISSRMNLMTWTRSAVVGRPSRLRSLKVSRTMLCKQD